MATHWVIPSASQPMNSKLKRKVVQKPKRTVSVRRYVKVRGEDCFRERTQKELQAAAKRTFDAEARKRRQAVTFDTKEHAAKAGAAIKKAFPIVVVTVVDTEKGTTETISSH